MRIFSGYFAFRAWAKRTGDAFKALTVEVLNPDAITINSGARAISVMKDGTEIFGIDTDGNQAAKGPVDVTASTLTVTAAAHAGRVVTLNRAAGIAVTLPLATGTGNQYRFYLGTTVTSNSTTIKVVDASDIMVGFAIQAADAGSTSNVWETAATDDTITFNGSTTGGIKGDFVELIDVATDTWAVRVTGAATGTEATPFSATV